MSTFDDFDTQVTAEEFYSGWTEDEADYYDTWQDEQAQDDLAEMDSSDTYSYELAEDWYLDAAYEDRTDIGMEY